MSAASIKELFEKAHERDKHSEALVHITELTKKFPKEQLTDQEKIDFADTMKELIGQVRNPLREAEQAMEAGEKPAKPIDKLKEEFRARIALIEAPVKGLYTNAANSRSKALYCRMLADLERYRFDCAANQQGLTTATTNAEMRYKEAQRITKDFDSSDLVCLQLALNFSAFQAVCLKDVKAAFRTCREAREDAILGGNKQDPLVIGTIDKLKANIDMWQEDYGPIDAFRDDNPS